MKISQQDRVRFGEPDANFNEGHNRNVIAQTIKKTNENHKKKKAKWEEGLMERSDAVYSYIRHVASGGNSGKSIENYLGNEYFMKLLGEERVRDLQSRASIPNLGKVKNN